MLMVALAACGADEEKRNPIPRNQAAVLNSRLTELQRRFDFGDGACTDIQQDTKPAVQAALDQLPKSVDGEVRRTLRESFDHLFDLARQQCDETKNAQTEPIQTTPPTPPPVTTAPPETTETQTQPRKKKKEENKKEDERDDGLPGREKTPEGVPINPE